MAEEIPPTPPLPPYQPTDDNENKRRRPKHQPDATETENTPATDRQPPAKRPPQEGLIDEYV